MKLNNRAFKTIKPHTKIAVCTLRFSDNLGDGVIEACLVDEIKRTWQDADIISFDLSGRKGYRDHGLKGLMQRVMYHSPRFLRPLWVLAAWPLLTRPKVQPVWESALEGADMLIFGGGQLLMDNDLNFPLKMAALCRLAKQKGVPVGFMACGVGGGWSAFARRLLLPVLVEQNVRFISVRDAASQRRLYQYGCLAPVSIVPDAAVLAGQAFDAPKKRARIGLGVANPHEMRLMAAEPEHFNPAHQTEFWQLLVAKLVDAGQPVTLFTNGSGEDEAYLHKLAAQLPSSSLVEIAPAPQTPHELVRLIGSFKAIAAYRLHAGIVAYGLGVPAVTLVWDAKVKAFAELAGRSDFCLHGEQVTAENVYQKLLAAKAAGVDKNHLKTLQNRAKKGVGSMLGALR